MSSRNRFPKASPTFSDKAATPEARPKKTFWFVRIVWLTVVLVWPLLKWIVSINVFFQGVRAIYYWDDPTVFAGWTFIAHFVLLTALTYFVSVYKPKGV